MYENIMNKIIKYKKLQHKINNNMREIMKRPIKIIT